MTLSLAMFGIDPGEVVEVSVRAEELGFDGIWVGDHVVAPVRYASEHPYETPGRLLPVIREGVWLHDVWVTLSTIAGATRRLQLAIGVLVLPLRPPLLTAQAAATLQRLSGGRFTLGVGSGWLAEEFAALGADFSTRGARTEEIVEVLRLAWTGKPFEHHGRWYDYEALQIGPEAVEVPIVFGGSAPRSLDRAARLGDGWYNPAAFDLDQCLQVRARIEAQRAGGPGEGRPFRYHIRLPPSWDRQAVETYRRHGFSDLVLPMGDLWQGGAPLAEKLRTVETAARELLS